MEYNSSSLVDTILEVFPDFAYFRVLFFVLGLCGTMLNLTSIGLLLSIKGRQRTQLKLLLSLAICDCFISILFVIKASVYIDTVFMIIHGLLQEVYGLPRAILSAIFLSIQWSSLVNMLFIAVDILLRVKRPLKYRQLMSRKRGNILITCAWVTSFLIFSNPATVLIMMQGNQTIYLIHPTASVLSLITFCIMYGCVIHGLRHHQRALSRVGTMAYTGRSNTAVRRTAVTTACILVSYTICLMPVMWFFIIIKANPSMTEDNVIFILLVLECIFLLNSIIDPLIYVTRVPEITNRLWDVLKHVRQWRNREKEEDTTIPTRQPVIDTSDIVIS